LPLLFIAVFVASTLASAMGLYFVVPFALGGLIILAAPFIAGYAIFREVHPPHAAPLLGKAELRDLDFIPSHFGRHPKVLIVDDDIDLTTIMSSVFRNLGCETAVANTPKDVHRMMTYNKPDFIVLDWMLSKKVTANQVVNRAIHLVDSVEKLQMNFKSEHPKVITYSVLDSSEISFPKSDYFEHLEHWQKPIQLSELTARTSEMLASYGF
jgi:CheY-like chemotaxis protein